MAKNIHIKHMVDQLVNTYETTNPYKLCRRLGLDICYEPLGSLNGLLLVDKRRGCILINSELEDELQLITCAHELGHFVLGHDSNRIFLSTHTFQRTERLEEDANTFAAELLGYNGEDSELAAMSCCEEHIAYIVEELVRLKWE